MRTRNYLQMQVHTHAKIRLTEISRVCLYSHMLGKIRRQKGMTQKALAAASGVDRTVICRIESGVIARPAWETVARLSKALGVSPEKIFPVGKTA